MPDIVVPMMRPSYAMVGATASRTGQNSLWRTPAAASAGRPAAAVRNSSAASPGRPSDAADVVAVVEKCLAQCPAAIVVDLHGFDNAVEHARTAVEITVGVLAEHLHIRVRDGSTTGPVRRPFTPHRPDAPLDLRGRGVRLLDRHAARWGTIRQPMLSGKER